MAERMVPRPKKTVLTDSQEAIATWLLAGVGFATSVLALVGFSGATAARLANSQTALFVIAVGLVLGSAIIPAASAIINFARKPFLIVGLLLLATGVGILIYLQATTSAKQDVPTIALSVKSVDSEANTVTISTGFVGSGLEPGQFLVLDILGLPSEDSNTGERIYRSVLGSDQLGNGATTIETVINQGSYALVVAEVFPGPIPNRDGSEDELVGQSQLCSDIQGKTARSCAYVRIPQE
ncbi:hypothetical protein ACNHUS_06315 [Actinomycetes bacterium M1A6_2h]